MVEGPKAFHKETTIQTVKATLLPQFITLQNASRRLNLVLSRHHLDAGFTPSPSNTTHNYTVPGTTAQAARSLRQGCGNTSRTGAPLCQEPLEGQPAKRAEVEAGASPAAHSAGPGRRDAVTATTTPLSLPPSLPRRRAGQGRGAVPATLAHRPAAEKPSARRGPAHGLTATYLRGCARRPLNPLPRQRSKPPRERGRGAGASPFPVRAPCSR